VAISKSWAKAVGQSAVKTNRIFLDTQGILVVAWCPVWVVNEWGSGEVPPVLKKTLPLIFPYYV